LALARVPEIESRKCLCRGGLEIVEYILLHYDNILQAWSRGAQFRRLVSEPESSAKVARQLIQSGKLGQFSLANRLLYKE